MGVGWPGGLGRLQGCRVTKMIGRAQLLRPLADPADRLGGGGIILTDDLTYPIVNFIYGFRPLHFQTTAF